MQQVVRRLASSTEVGERDATCGFSRRLKVHDPLIGTVLTVPSVGLAELAAGPVDFVWIDLEHGALGPAEVQPLAIAARAAGTAVLVRLASAGGSGTGAVLDAGVEGVVAPRVESPDGAAQLVQLLRHPPRGTRGVAARRSAGYGRAGPVGEPDPGTDPLCMVQIESPLGVRNATEIAAVDGVDALIVGCADLSHSLGERGRLRSPAVSEAIEQVQRAAAAAGIPSGIAGPDDPALLAELAAGRSSILVLSADVRMYAQAVDSGVAALRRELAACAPEPMDAHVGA
jgi:4-hydroxy-2-oxoheptanedioate aldolase